MRKLREELSQEFSRLEKLIIGELSRLDDFLMNRRIQGHSGTTPEASRNAFSTSKETNEDDSQSDPHPEADIRHNQTTQNSGPEDGHDMVTGVTEDIRNRDDMLTGVHEEVTYCSTSTSSGKQKKDRSPSQSQFRCEKAPATFEADQVLLALQQLANNNNSANFRTILTEFPNCQSHSRQRCPVSTGNLKC